MFLSFLNDRDFRGLAVAGGTIYASYSETEEDRIDRVAAATGEVLGSIGSAGTGEGQLSVPTGLALDADGNLYVADTNNHRVQIFDPSGAFVAAIGAFGTGEGEFNRPNGVAVDDGGNLFVLDELNERVQKFRPAGTASRLRAASAGGRAGAEPRDQRRTGKRRSRKKRG